MIRLKNFDAFQLPDAMDVFCSWDEPLVFGEWIQWDNGENYEALGLSGGGTFQVASHWDQTQLAPYNGMYITHLSIYPLSSSLIFIENMDR